MSRGLREIAAPFVAAAPAGVATRTRLRPSEDDAEVLREAGTFLGRLAGRDLAARCAEGNLGPKAQAESTRERKRGLTVECSSRQAGTITRVSEGQYRAGRRNQLRHQRTLRGRIRAIEARAQVPCGERRGKTRGYKTPAERHQKLMKARRLQADLDRLQADLDAGRVHVVRGGRRLLHQRANLEAVGRTPEGWRQDWDDRRLFLSADGDAAQPWGNATITWNPDEETLEVNLPKPLAHLANRPRGRYRLSCPVTFSHLGPEVAAQAATGAVHYDITPDPESGRWYVTASWKVPPPPPVTLEELQTGTVVSVDLNDGHLAAAVVAADGNVLGIPFTVPLDLDGLPAPTRDGRLRAAVTTLIATARDHGAKAIVIEDLDFAEAREQGRERTGNRPSRGRRGRACRRMVVGIPTAKFRDRLAAMTANVGLSLVAIDPAYTSKWAAVHWLPLLRRQHPETTGHHAAALVIGRRGLGHRARTRANGNRTAPEEAVRPARARPRKPSKARLAQRKGAAPPGTRPPPGRKTGTPDRTTARNQAPQDRTAMPAEHSTVAQCQGTVI